MVHLQLDIFQINKKNCNNNDKNIHWLLGTSQLAFFCCLCVNICQSTVNLKDHLSPISTLPRKKNCIFHIKCAQQREIAINLSTQPTIETTELDLVHFCLISRYLLYRATKEKEYTSNSTIQFVMLQTIKTNVFLDSISRPTNEPIILSAKIRK